MIKKVYQIKDKINNWFKIIIMTYNFKKIHNIVKIQVLMELIVFWKSKEKFIQIIGKIKNFLLSIKKDRKINLINIINNKPVNSNKKQIMWLA